MSLLSNMLYPEQVPSAGGFYPKVGGSPIFKLRLVNFVRSTSTSGVHTYSAASESGLLGYIDGFNYNFTLDEGFFLDASGQALPKNIEANFNYYPVHEKSPAWINKKFNYKGYPYKEGRFLHEVPQAAVLGAAYDPTSGIAIKAAKGLTDPQ